MSVGVGLAVGYGPAPLEESVVLAEAAEAAGLAFVAVGDAGADTFALLGAIAARTREIGLLSGIATWSRTPVTTALAATTVASIAQGRYRLGLGTMPQRWAEDWHGLAFEQPVARMRDFVAAVRAAWRAEASAPVTHEGPFYRLRDFPGHAAERAHPIPLSLAATRRRMTALAGEVADGVIFNCVHSRDWLAGDGRTALADGAAAGGRDLASLDVGVLRICAIDDDRRRAYELARPGLAFYFAIPYFAERLREDGFLEELEQGTAAAARGDWGGQVAAVSDGMVEAMCIAGTPADVRRQLAAYDGVVDWVELAGTVGHPPAIARTQCERIITTCAAATVGADEERR